MSIEPLLDGTKSCGTFDLPNGNTISLRTDIEAAHQTVANLRILEEMGAHDASWMAEGTDWLDALACWLRLPRH
jgi:hypothetical protein